MDFFEGALAEWFMLDGSSCKNPGTRYAYATWSGQLCKGFLGLLRSLS